MDALIRRHRLAFTAAVLSVLLTASPAFPAVTTDETQAIEAGQAMDSPAAPPPPARTSEPHYPAWGVTLGVSGFLNSFSDVEAAYRRIEAAYAADDIQLHRAGAVAMRPVVVPTLTVQINPRLQVAWQAGAAVSHDDQFFLTGGLVTGRYPLPARPDIALIGGVGVGRYGFKFHRDFGQVVVPADPSGVYTTLDDIELKGGGPYWSAAAGISIRPAPTFAIECLYQYLGTNEVKTLTEHAVPISLDLSGGMLGGSLTIFF